MKNIANSIDFHKSPSTIDQELAELNTEAARLEAKLAQINARRDHLDEVFVARGGWTRSFLVNNANGHLHTSTHCSSCFSTTEFQWRTELSGQTEAEIVAAAGELACTVCYPDAPVEITSKPGTIRTDAMIAREERAAEAAKREAAKQAKGILTPEGQPLRMDRNVVKTERAAEINAVSNLSNVIFYGYTHPDQDRWVTDAIAAAEALAAKRGTDFDTEITLIGQKAAAKVVRDQKAADAHAKRLGWA